MRGTLGNSEVILSTLRNKLVFGVFELNHLISANEMDKGSEVELYQQAYDEIMITDKKAAPEVNKVKGWLFQLKSLVDHYCEFRKWRKMIENDEKIRDTQEILRLAAHLNANIHIFRDAEINDLHSRVFSVYKNALMEDVRFVFQALKSPKPVTTIPAGTPTFRTKMVSVQD
jgi:hypothetical protein